MTAEATQPDSNPALEQADRLNLEPRRKDSPVTQVIEQVVKRQTAQTTQPRQATLANDSPDCDLGRTQPSPSELTVDRLAQ